jgi:hypothetical protein|tara:strand:- start:370 stop:630 length:261 start_codon:yes stop_codon:yes gene_type:complete
LIIQLEIEQLIKVFNKHDTDKARDAINVLNRVLLELRQSNERLRQSMLLTSESELSSLEQLILNRELLQEVELLRIENKHLKKNIK